VRTFARATWQAPAGFRSLGGAQKSQGFLVRSRRYEITRHDPARRRLCHASIHLASLSRIKTNQISGSDFRVARRRFSVGMYCLLQFRTISASHDYNAQSYVEAVTAGRGIPPLRRSRTIAATQPTYLCRVEFVIPAQPEATVAPTGFTEFTHDCQRTTADAPCPAAPCYRARVYRLRRFRRRVTVGLASCGPALSAAMIGRA
jgi:hypothetical protein